MQISSTTQKVNFKRLRPNPLFEDWLSNTYEEAKLKKSALEPMLKEATESLAKYPLPLKSGAECIILKGFDKKLCLYLDKCLNNYNHNLALSQYCDSGCDSTGSRKRRSESPTSTTSPIPFETCITTSSSNSPTSNGHPPVEKLPKVDTQSEAVVIDIQGPSSTENVPKKDKKKKYKPAHRSGGYALLVALLEQSLENPDNPSLSKEDLIEKAQKHSEESFVRPKPNSFYTAWSNMTRLVSKGLVEKIKKKKAEYLLTASGKVLAREILEDAKSVQTVNDIIFNDIPSTSSGITNQSSSPKADEVPSTSGIAFKKDVIELPPGSFDIVLLIDKNETGGLKKKNDPTVAQFKKYPDLNHEYRSLKVGDFTWIARSKDNPEHELVLPFVIERKRMDDLGASIKDGRFHEQKFRLRKCGLDNVIYMVENYGKNKHVGLPVQSLMQALANTRVQDDFKVHVTDSLTNSVRFLAMMTKRLTIRFKDKQLSGRNEEPKDEFLMTFEYFNKSSAKNKALTVTETFIKILLQLKGMSVEKALAITNKYQTPRALIHAYVKCDRKEGELLLAHLKYGDLNRNVGPVVSKSIYQLFSSGGAE
uniref:Crossover junction endonuclease MUS81 n=1 Tax=Heliothis virescens TaxID=7102 RepID=A0A2A4J0I2_HELVI